MSRTSTVSRKSSPRCKTSKRHKKTHRRNKHKSYQWTNAPYYKCAPTHRAFSQKERAALDKAVNTYRDTLDFPYGVEELIDWRNINIPRRTAQECKDEWHTFFGNDSAAVCLRRGKRFWRIQYYNDIVDSKDMNAGHPAYVYLGINGSTRPHSYLIPHTSATEVQQLIQEKKKQGYINDGTHDTGAVYLLYDDLRKMPVGTTFTVGINTDTGTPGAPYGIECVQVKEHFEHYTTLHDVEHPSHLLYSLFRGSLLPGGASYAKFHTTLAVYTNAEFPLIFNPNPQDPIYGIHWQLPSTKPSLMKRIMNNLSAGLSKESRLAALYGGVSAAFVGTAISNSIIKMRSRRNRTKNFATTP